MSPNVLVNVSGLHKSFGDAEVLRGMDFEVERGEVVAIIGPSGSGKTTMLRCVNLLERPSAGRIEVDGRILCEEQADGSMSFASTTRPLPRMSNCCAACSRARFFSAPFSAPVPALFGAFF